MACLQTGALSLKPKPMKAWRAPFTCCIRNIDNNRNIQLQGAEAQTIFKTQYRLESTTRSTYCSYSPLGMTSHCVKLQKAWLPRPKRFRHMLPSDHHGSVSPVLQIGQYNIRRSSSEATSCRKRTRCTRPQNIPTPHRARRCGQSSIFSGKPPSNGIVHPGIPPDANATRPTPSTCVLALPLAWWLSVSRPPAKRCHLAPDARRAACLARGGGHAGSCACGVGGPLVGSARRRNVLAGAPARWRLQRRRRGAGSARGSR